MRAMLRRLRSALCPHPGPRQELVERELLHRVDAPGGVRSCFHAKVLCRRCGQVRVERYYTWVFHLPPKAQ